MIMIILLWVGLVGALLMFGGDMLLYYSKENYQQDGTYRPLVEIMKKLPAWRLQAGGMIGPIAAFFYCVGFAHLLYLFKEEHIVMAWVAFLCTCLGVIVGGAYHSHWSYMGLFAKIEDQKAMDIVLALKKKLEIVMYVFEGIGFMLLLLGVMHEWTAYPLYYFLFTPGFLFILLPLLRKIPQPFYLCIVGGWSNLISVIYYIAALLFFM